MGSTATHRQEATEMNDESDTPPPRHSHRMPHYACTVFLIVGSVIGDILHHILLFFQHLALFSRYCVKLKIEHLSPQRSNPKKLGVGNLMIFPIPDNITHMHKFCKVNFFLEYFIFHKKHL